MNHPRSIRARLIALYVVILSLIFVGLGGYTYWGFRQYLVHALQQALQRRAHQIAATILADVPQRGPAYIGSEVQARYAPELNERLIRVTDQRGTTVYASRNAAALIAPPTVAFTGSEVESSPVVREELGENTERFQVVAIGYRLSDGTTYTVEVGASENEISTALHGFLITLLLGFPAFVGLTAVGAYVLLGRALRPVDEIVRSAERITLKNLSRRLPVPNSGDEVERLSLALNRMIQRLDESYQITSRFSADASHELRTPLTIMRGELEALLKEGEMRNDHAGQIESILEEAERLTKIVEGLLTLSRLDTGEAQLGKEAVDLSSIVEATVEQMEPLAAEKSLAMEHHAEPMVIVEANELRLKQVIVNLLDNAIKYTPEGGKISVQLKSNGPTAILEVTDNGIGISEEALPHIFERFYRSRQVLAHRAQGTGLGLSMVQSIIDAHGGKIQVKSRENEGSTFRIELPCLEKTDSVPPKMKPF